MDLIITILPVVTKGLPISPRFTPYNFLSRCKFRTLTTRQPMVEFYLLTFPRFPLRKKEHKSCFGKNRTHDFRTSRCAGYLLDHPGDYTGPGPVPTRCLIGSKSTLQNTTALLNRALTGVFARQLISTAQFKYLILTINNSNGRSIACAFRVRKTSRPRIFSVVKENG